MFLKKMMEIHMEMMEKHIPEMVTQHILEMTKAHILQMILKHILMTQMVIQHISRMSKMLK